jgi:hypothetical protein
LRFSVVSASKIVKYILTVVAIQNTKQFAARALLDNILISKFVTTGEGCPFSLPLEESTREKRSARHVL